MVRKILRITLILILFGIWIGDSIAAPEKRSPVVYIDPLFGGEENGPVLNQKYLGKTITLDLAKKLCTMLQKRDILSILSREQDSFLTLGQRIMKAREKRADVHIAINFVKSQKNCIHISYQKRLNKPYTIKGKDDTGGILFDLMGDKILKDSAALARSIKDKVKAESTVNCAIAEPRSTYLLENSLIPTIVIGFQVQESGSMPPYILDPVSVDKILHAIAEGIKKYLQGEE
jgi:N-acetylmuramoyl-L-alanine amidase